MNELYRLIAALFFCILEIPLGNAATTTWQMPRPLPASHISRLTLPFSFEQVVSYFDDAFENPGSIIRNNSRQYVESNALGDYTAMVVSGVGQRIKVALVTNGDWGVNHIREFFEAPFFLRSESERLYALLDAHPTARWANLGRFDVQIEVFETRQSIIITAEFGPPGNYQSRSAL